MCPDPIQGHGYMVDPLSRSATMRTTYQWDVDGCDNGAINWTPQGSFCGGRTTQENNDGKCSACGDNYATSYPRPHDYGGIYAQDIEPTRIYLQGQEITVIVKITASHLGNFTFKLCNKLETDYPDQDILTDCFNNQSKHTVLPDENGIEVFGGINRTGLFVYNLVLPSDVTCPRGCSLQWWYVTGNSPNLFPEHFVNCADIRIVNCDQYSDEDNSLTWCGLGPTSELTEWCGDTDTGNTNEDSSTEENTNESSSNEYNSEEGNENEGYTYNSEANGNTEESSGYSESASQDGDEFNEEESQSSGNCTGNSGESSNQDDSGPPSCTSCTNAQSPTCNNNCCSQSVREVYVSTITNAPDMWCEFHCTDDPPFCPAKWCCKKEVIHWVYVCSAKKSLTSSLVDLLERKVQEIKNKRAKKRS